MTSKMTVFDHFMNPIAEIESPTTPRGWVLNNYSQAEFSVSLSDAKCTETNFQIGNLVHVEHLPSEDADGNVNGKLPDWVGILLPPRNWDFGVLHITAYSAEAVLAFRAMPFVTIKGTPRSMFLQIVSLAHAAANNIVIQPGVVEDLPQTFSDDLRLSAYDHIQRLVRDANMDWDVTSEIDDRGRLKLYANLYVRKGVETDLILTNKNTELASPLLSEQGTPSNQVFGYSQAYTEQSRHKVVGVHQSAVDDYGPLQMNQVFVGKHDENSVRAAAQNQALSRGRPVKMVRRIALDSLDTFSKLEPGNVVTVKDATVGFAPGGGFGMEARARILSVDYNDLSNNSPLNLEVL